MVMAACRYEGETLVSQPMSWPERASGADADGLENKDEKDNDEDSENGDAGCVLRASGADAADGLENKDGKDSDGDSANGDAGGVLRASGADADGLENKDRATG
jgi:hypothetical protein